MKSIYFLLLSFSTLFAQNSTSEDWLLSNKNYLATIAKSHDNKDLIMTNGLIKRTIRIAPNAATIDYVNLTTNEQYVRAVKPEGRIVINGKPYNIGGLVGQKEQAYLQKSWIENLKSEAGDFQYKSFKITELTPKLSSKITTWASNKQNAKGKKLELYFESNLADLKNVIVVVNYEIFDNIPVLSKWLTIQNYKPETIKINQVVNEILAVPEAESAVVGKPIQMKVPQHIFIENNFAFNNAMKYEISDQATHWKIDSTYTSQVNYNFETPCLLEVYPNLGVGIELSQNQIFKSVCSYELLLDSYDRERNGLARKRMYSTIFPHTTQNPIFMHLVSTEPAQVKSIIDQCVETGYEMVILSFGSGLNMEDTTAANIKKYKELTDYAHSKGIKLGGYSLFSSRRIDDETDVIDPITGLPDKGAFFGNAPCLASKWGIAYLKKLEKFIDETGFDLLEHDGPYPGDVCASTKHPGHTGLHDSQWKQMEMQQNFYKTLNEKGVYINAPDWYFMAGSHKIGLGYREVNFSLPREQQKILNRQNIFDGTWDKTPSMSWGFVPLTKYQGGGPEAVLEPLNDHLVDYEQLMVQYYGAGVQACYRGPRLYDTEKTKETVKKTLDWYKKYREILNSDIIHLRRPDGREWDGIMHLNPKLKQKGFVLLYNPIKEKITRKISLPLYYSGLSNKISIREKEGKMQTLTLNRNYEATLNVEIPAEGYTWFVIE